VITALHDIIGLLQLYKKQRSEPLVPAGT